MNPIAVFYYRYDEAEIKIMFETGFLWITDTTHWVSYDQYSQAHTLVATLDYHRVASNWIELL